MKEIINNPFYKLINIVAIFESNSNYFSINAF